MKTILIIEDNESVRENTAEILELANYKVLQAENGKIGVELAQTAMPDLIICDIMMPVLDGYGVIYMLNKNADTASIPFIFLTAKSEREDYRKSMEMGADGYIHKPFDDVELLNAVESRLKKAEILQAKYSKSVQGLDKFYNEAKKFDDLKKLSGERRNKRFRKKDIIFSKGNEPAYLYFLVEGRVKTFRSHPYGKEFTTGLYTTGDFFGYVPLFEEKSYAESAEALEDSEVCLIPKEDFYAFIGSDPNVIRTFIKMLSGNIDEKAQQLVNVAYSTVRKRVIEALLDLYKHYGKPEEKTFSISISREDLANLVGTATASLIRSLGELKEQNLVVMKGSTIIVPDIDKLKRAKA
ncbi:MAG: response regulator [Bacteroidetes bacterium]|nr:response regulator [Bacteroidota bacterium]